MNDNQKGIHYLYRNRKLFLLAIALGAFTGLGITFLIPKKFLSTAIVYPANAHTQDQVVGNPQFGYEIETEQLLQLLGSKSMRDKTVTKFKLYDYYELDTSNPSWDAELALRYINDVTFMRSKYLSVVVNVTMTDPNLAADIANFQIEEINRYRTAIFEQNRKAQYDFSKEELEQSEKELKQLRDTIYAIKGGKSDLVFNFIENLNNENFDPSGFINDPRLESVIVDYRFALSKYTTARENFATVKRDYEKPIPSIYSIDTAVPSFKKVSPSFAINIALGAIVMFLLVFTIRYTLDKWRDIKIQQS